MFSSGKTNRIREHELRPLFESQVCEMRGITSGEAKAISRELLQKIQVDTGFFLERGFDDSGQSVYGFLHPTFAEYLTARFLAEQWSSGQFELGKYAHNAHWHEVLLLMAGHIGTWATAQATRLVKEILELGSQYEEYLHHDLFLAAEVLGDNVRVKREIQDMIVSNLISIALKTPHLQLWRSSVKYLADIAKVFQLGRPVLQLESQKSDDAETRIRKAVLLVMAGEDTDETLLEVLHGVVESKDTKELVDPFLHSESMFGFLDDATHIMAIQTATSWSFHRLAKRIAERITRIYPMLCDIDNLLEEQVAIDKNYCQLWLFGPQDILKLDASKMTSLLIRNDWHAKSAIIAVILAGESHIHILKQLIREATSGNELENRVASLNFLGWLFSGIFVGSSEYEQEILSELSKEICFLAISDEIPNIRSNALRVLSSIPQKPKDWADILYQALSDNDVRVRSTSVGLASQFGSRIPTNILNMLRKLLTDSSPTVRRNSAWALIEIGKFEEEDISILLEEGFKRLPESKEAGEWNSWLEHLLRLSSRTSSPKKLNVIGTRIKEFLENEIVNDEMDSFYWNPLFGRKKILPREELAEIVSKLFTSLNPVIRARSVTIWSYLRSESIQFSEIKPLLMDNNPKVRSAAIRILRSRDLQESSAVDLLLQSLIAENSVVASSAASTLSRVQTPELRQRVIVQVASLLEQTPEDKFAFEVLWNLKIPHNRLIYV